MGERRHKLLDRRNEIRKNLKGKWIGEKKERGKGEGENERKGERKDKRKQRPFSIGKQLHGSHDNATIVVTPEESGQATGMP